MAGFTSKDAKELGMPLSLLDGWKLVMDYLWDFFSAYKKVNKKASVRAVDNMILYSLPQQHCFKIYVNFINRKYLSLCVEIEGIEDFKVNIDKIDEFGREGIIMIVANIVTFGEKIK